MKHHSDENATVKKYNCGLEVNVYKYPEEIPFNLIKIDQNSMYSQEIKLAEGYTYSSRREVLA
jgi:hypothetical protein